MLKECVILNGKVINIGPWDYQYKEIGGKQIAMNPLPEGAEIVEMEVVEGPDGGLYPAGYVPPETSDKKIARLEAELAAAREENMNALEAIAELYEMMLAKGSGGV